MKGSSDTVTPLIDQGHRVNPARSKVATRKQQALATAKSIMYDLKRQAALTRNLHAPRSALLMDAIGNITVLDSATLIELDFVSTEPRRPMGSGFLVVTANISAME
jgi:hypothetical protein